MSDIIKNVRSWLRRQERVRKTIHELSCLNDRELADIGVNRSDIYRIAKEA